MSKVRIRAASVITCGVGGVVGSGPSGGTPRSYFCQPWRGQPAARWNRRATRPNAIRVSVITVRGSSPRPAQWRVDHSSSRGTGVLVPSLLLHYARR
jgi:hypothetical protein